MKGFSIGLKWATAAVLLVTVTGAPAFAAKTTPVTGKNSAVPVVPRAIPNLIPYHKFDPPTSKLFDASKLNISGDLRVRPEFRNAIRFGLAAGSGANSLSDNSLVETASKPNDFFVQQWVRLGFHYTISPDVAFFFQPQYSKNWGGGNNPEANKGSDSPGNSIFARQAFMVVRNFGLKGLTVKAGRQLVVWGNHRMFGHFDWNNIGWSHDGLTANYASGALKKFGVNALQFGWLRTDEGDCGATGGGCSTATNSGTSGDDNILYFRAPMKVAGFVLEPTWIWISGGTGAALNGNRPTNQSRHTVGGRAVTKRTLGKLRVDVTGEGYWQFGQIGIDGQTRRMNINAYALHVDGGVTLPVPMAPRIGLEFNQASGDSAANTCNTNNNQPNDQNVTDGCNSVWRGFDQLYPTNHIHFGYMDRMSWKNMVHLGGTLNLRPSANSHFEIAAHKFWLNEVRDNWYSAAQGIYVQTPLDNQEDSLGEEVDVIYTHFFTPGNHVAWQIGGGVFFPGDYIDGNPASGYNGASVGNETWGYTQLWINW